MTQIAMFAEWRAELPPVDFDPNGMVVTTSVLGEASAVILLCGEPWMGVVQLEGKRKLVMWHGVEHHHAVTRVSTAAKRLGLRVLPPRGKGDLRVGGVAIVVTHECLRGSASTAFRLEAGPGVQVVGAGSGVWDKDVRSRLRLAVKRGRVEMREKADAGRWL